MSARRPPARPSGYTNRKPTAFTLFGKTTSVRNWREVLLGVCQALAARHGEEVQRLLEMRGRGRPWFLLNKRDLRQPKLIPGTSLFVEANINAALAVSMCRKVLSHMGHDPNELQIELR